MFKDRLIDGKMAKKSRGRLTKCRRLWEAEAGGQEIETILVNVVKPHLY